MQQLLVTQGPPGSQLCAFLRVHADRGGSLEAMDRPMGSITQEESSQGDSVGIGLRRIKVDEIFLNKAILEVCQSVRICCPGHQNTRRYKL
jgi:hypothetical protein